MITREEFDILRLLSDHEIALTISKMSIEDRLQFGYYAQPDLAEFLSNPITNGE